MPRIADSYVIVGPGPFGPRQDGFRDTTENSLRDSAAWYRARAKEAARISADEAEAPNAKAAILEAALTVILGDSLPAEGPALPAGPPAPVANVCEWKGCGALASHGFGLRGEIMRWACGDHVAEIEAEYQADRAERLKRAAEILEKSDTSMAGVPGYLI